MERFDFPKWIDRVISVIPILVVAGVLYIGAVALYACAPETTDVGYAPVQPVPYSHKLHAGELKIDCRYCHNTVEDAAFAAVPATKTCINCHHPTDSDGQAVLTAVHVNSPKLAKIRESWATGEPVVWKKVHDLPDYAYFNHSVHVTKGVSCKQCHGRVDQMEIVKQVEPLSMGWCLKCHRDPAPNLWPAEHVTDLDWDAGKSAEDLLAIGTEVAQSWKIPPYTDELAVIPPDAMDSVPDVKHPVINQNTNCSTCHR